MNKEKLEKYKSLLFLISKKIDLAIELGIIDGSHIINEHIDIGGELGLANDDLDFIISNSNILDENIINLDKEIKLLMSL